MSNSICPAYKGKDHWRKKIIRQVAQALSHSLVLCLRLINYIKPTEKVPLVCNSFTHTHAQYALGKWMTILSTAFCTSPPLSLMILLCSQGKEYQRKHSIHCSHDNHFASPSPFPQTRPGGMHIDLVIWRWTCCSQSCAHHCTEIHDTKETTWKYFCLFQSLGLAKSGLAFGDS